MAYIGQKPFQEFTSIPTKDSFTGDGSTTTFDLANDVVRGAEFALEVFIDNVRQEPGSGKAFTLGVDGSNNYRRITFTAAPANGASIYVINDKTNLTTIAPVQTDFNGVEIVLDADSDTTLHAETDDQVDLRIAGNDVLKFLQSSGDAVLKPMVDAKDIIFQQFDGNKVFEINDGNFVGVGGNATAPGEIRIFEDSDNGTNYSGFKAAANTTSSVAYQLPAADGSAGTQLTTDGSGVLSWSAAGVTLANDVNNRIVTATGSGLNGESDLTFDGTTLALTGNSTVSGTLGVTGIATFTDDIVIGDGKTIGSASDNDAITIPSNGIVEFSAGFSSGNLTFSGQELDLSSGDFTIDVAGDIILDADGGDVFFKDGGTTIATLSNTSSDFVITTGVQDKDFIIKGDDGGSGITALTIDMSDAGTAVFNHDIKLGDNGKAIFGASSDLQIYHDDTNTIINNATGTLKVQADEVRFQNAAGNETIFGGTADGAAFLVHNDATKITTSATGATIDGTLLVSGTTPSITVGDGGAEDTKILFDGNAQNFYIGLDDSTDKLTIGLGSSVGSTVGFTMDENTAVEFPDNTVTIISSGNHDMLTLKSTDADAASGPVMNLVRDSSSPADGDSIGRINFSADNDAGQSETFIRIKAAIVDASDGSEDGQLRISRMINGGDQNVLSLLSAETVINDDSKDLDFRVETDGDTHALFVEGSSNNVGIGCDSPQTKLSVGDDDTGSVGTTGKLATFSQDLASTFAEGNVGTIGGINIINNDETSNRTAAGITLAHRSSSSGIAYVTSTSTAADRADLRFGTRGSDGIKERVQIDSNGNVGIGVAPSETFHVVHTTSGQQAAKFHTDTNDEADLGISILAGKDTGSSSGDSKWVRLADGNDSGKAYIQFKNSSPNAEFAAISDERLKQNIQNTDVVGLDVINNLRLVKFDWNETAAQNAGWSMAGHQKLGFVAQEVEEIVPEFISEDPNGFKIMGDSGFIPYLIKAVQEQQTKIQELETKITQLENANVLLLEDE